MLSESQIGRKLDFSCNPRVRLDKKPSFLVIRATDGSRISWISYALCDISLPCRPQDGLNGLPYLSILGLIVNLRSFPGVVRVQLPRSGQHGEPHCEIGTLRRERLIPRDSLSYDLPLLFSEQCMKLRLHAMRG